MSLPAATRRLFPNYHGEDLTPEGAGPLLMARVLEDGDAADLAWLFGTFPESTLTEWLTRHGGRQLAARSRAFWEVVLGCAAGPAHAEAAALWPL